MRSETLIIKLQKEIQRLQKENNILNNALFNACQTICKDLNYKEFEVIKLKKKYINKACGL